MELSFGISMQMFFWYVKMQDIPTIFLQICHVLTCSLTATAKVISSINVHLYVPLTSILVIQYM